MLRLLGALALILTCNEEVDFTPGKRIDLTRIFEKKIRERIHYAHSSFLGPRLNFDDNKLSCLNIN